MNEDSDIQARHRPVLRESQCEPIRAVALRRAWLKRQIAAAKRGHAIYIADLRAQLNALPTPAQLAAQYGVSPPTVMRIGSGRKYKYPHLLDEREQRA